LVRHAAGDERIRLSLYGKEVEVLAGLDSNGRYWLLNAIFHAQSEARHEGEDKQATRYRQAFVDGRLRKRKERNGTAYKVWIEPKIIPREPVPPDSTIPAGTEILLNSGQ
jgi:ABC-type sugar transport system ATPase subunit